MLERMRNFDSLEELQRALAKIPRLVVHVTASWNARYDSEMQKCLKLIRSRYNDRIAFATLDSDVEIFWPLLREWKVLNLPALLLFAFGRHIRTQIGLRSEQQFIELFDGLLAVPEHAEQIVEPERRKRLSHQP
jgi:hypothetical protein